MDKNHLKDLWWGMALRGIVALLFGVAVVFWPSLTLATLILLFSAYILVSGVLELLAGVTTAGNGARWYFRILVGILELGVGIYLVRHTTVTFDTFIALIGSILVARGVIDAVATLLDDSFNISQKTINFIISLVGFVAGIIILAQQQKNGIAFVWILGVYALVTGTLSVAMAVNVKNLLDRDTRK